MPEPILLLNVDSTILALNGAAAGLFGEDVHQLQGQRLATLVADDPDKLERYLRLCARAAGSIPSGLRAVSRERIRLPAGPSVESLDQGGSR